MAENTFSHRLRVRYVETDAQGIVFNAHYLMFFDVAITECFRAKQMPYIQFVESEKLDFHVIHAEQNFKSPARFDDEIDIYLSATFSGPKIFWNFTIKRGETILCDGNVTYIGVDKTSGKVKRIPTETAVRLGWLPETKVES